VRLLVDHRDNLVAEPTRAINRLRWHLHELDPSWQPPARTLWRPKHLRAIGDRLASVDGTVARLARGLVERCRQLSTEIAAIDKELEVVVRPLTPALLEVYGCATITAAKLVGETADVRRFRSRHAYARHNGTAPLPVWSGDRVRHRLSRAGNRQLNPAIHRVAITQAHYHRDAHAFLERRRTAGDTKAESLGALKGRLSDVIYRALLIDAELNSAPPTALDAT
jgi:transposase